jgi:hypothetical protein
MRFLKGQARALVLAVEQRLARCKDSPQDSGLATLYRHYIGLQILS